MANETTKTPRFEELAQEIEVVEKAKVLIISLFKTVPVVWIAIRSEHEHTRQHESDPPGGKRKPRPADPNERRETPVEGLVRDVREEFPNFFLENIVLLGERKKVKDGLPTRSRIYGANSEEQAGGVVFGKNEDGHYEHGSGEWHPLRTVPYILDLPKKYREEADPLTGKAALLAGLVETAYPVTILRQLAPVEEPVLVGG